MIYLIWFWWIFIIIFLPIVQLNFLIAFISEAFEDVLDSSMQIKYTQRCRLSTEYYLYKSFFQRFRNFFTKIIGLGKEKTSSELYLVTGDMVVE